MPKVSVIVPVYGVEKTIERCARSLFSQSLEDAEFIFVNDCTRDGSIALLRKVIGEFPERKVTIVDHTVNKGLPLARQTGLEYAKGDYVIHIDSDDWVEPDILEKMHSLAVAGAYDIVICNYRKHFPDGSSSCPYPDMGAVPEDRLCSATISGQIGWSIWNRMVRRSLYQQVKEFPVLNMGEDMALSISLAVAASKTAVLDECLYNYSVNPEGLTGKADIHTLLDQVKKNMDIAERAIASRGLSGRYSGEIMAMKSFLKVKALKMKWKDYLAVAPELNFTMPFNRFTPLKTRLGHITKMLGIHGISALWKTGH